MTHRSCAVAALLTLTLAAATAPAQEGAKHGEWPTFSADAGSTRYSPLSQIDATNVARLEPAWRWECVDAGIVKLAQGMRIGYFKSTPLMVNGTLYVTTPMNQVAALDPGTGETLWVFDTKAYEGNGRKGPSQHRGLAYWSNGPEKRVFIATGGRRLYSIDADTGKPDQRFGDRGWIDLGKGFDRPVNESQLRFSAPPAVVGNTLVLGCLLPDEASNPDIAPGHVRGFDARTGAQKWIFYTIPHAGEPGNETWEDNSWESAGAANVWSMISTDPKLGYVYCPTGTPANDFYGGHRPGDNLFAESVVCLNAETGERVWHFQGVHHGLWDYDFPAAPILIDITVEGKRVRALVQVSKQGFAYVLDRVTGEPVWPIEERPVPQTDVPGERTARTQPFPTKPPAFERQGITEDDLIDFTPALREAALEFVNKYRLGPLYTPPAIAKSTGEGATIQLPGAAGGANWGSAGVDPETGRLFVQSATQPTFAGLLEPDQNLSAFRYKRGGPWMLEGPNGLPLTKPPYGRITAIDLNRGEILWQVAHGDGPRDHPLLKDLNLPPLGWGSNTFLSGSGPVVTKSLVFFSHAPVNNATGAYIKDEAALRAFDKDTGAVIWEEKLPLLPYGVPMTYMHGGRQFLVVATGGMDQPAALLAYALPE